jgi:hypothetical protein
MSLLSYLNQSRDYKRFTKPGNAIPSRKPFFFDGSISYIIDFVNEDLTFIQAHLDVSAWFIFAMMLPKTA